MNVSSTKRQNMSHLEAMKDLDFIALCQSLDGGTMSGLKTVMKVDGLAARFGKDKDGNIFFESARSGPVFEPGTFSIYTMEKGGSDESIERSRHYDNLLLFFKISGVLKDLPNNTKIVCEVLYTPLSQEEDDGFRFVSVKYSKKAITKKLTILQSDEIHGKYALGEEIEGVVVWINNQEYKCTTPEFKNSKAK